MKKRLLASLLNLLGIVGLFIWFRRLFKKEILVLAYHRILSTDENSPYQYDEELISTDSEGFKWQINFLKKRFDIINFAELSERLAGRKKLTGRELLITFDDGFSDNYSNAFPILKSENVPATFYISTDYIGAKKTFWFNEIVHSIKTAEQLSFTLGDEQYNFEPTDTNREKVIQLVLDKLKQVSNQKRLSTIESLYEDLNFNADKTPASELPMTWDNVVEMSENNMEFGSHSVSHPILSRLDASELEHEIAHSKQHIESMINKPCISIAYPVGGEDAFTDNVESQSKSAGYDFGLSYISGTNHVEALDMHSLKRMHVERYINKEEFKMMLYFPRLY